MVAAADVVGVLFVSSLFRTLESTPAKPPLPLSRILSFTERAATSLAAASASSTVCPTLKFRAAEIAAVADADDYCVRMSRVGWESENI